MTGDKQTVVFHNGTVTVQRARIGYKVHVVLTGGDRDGKTFSGWFLTYEGARAFAAERMFGGAS